MARQPIHGPGLLTMVTARLAFPCLPTFTDDEPHNPEGSRRVYPPSADQELRDERTDGHEGEPTARDALDRIGAKGPATKRVSDLKLALREKVHDGDGEHGDGEAGQREICALLHP